MAFTIEYSKESEAFARVLGFVGALPAMAMFVLTRVPKLAPKLERTLETNVCTGTLARVAGAVSEIYLVLLNLGIMLGAWYNMYYIGPIEASDATGVGINENGFVNSCGFGAIYIAIPLVMPNLPSLLSGAAPAASKEASSAVRGWDLLWAHVAARLGMIREVSSSGRTFVPASQAFSVAVTPYAWYFVGLGNLAMFITRDVTSTTGRLAMVIAIAAAGPPVAVGLPAALIDMACGRGERKAVAVARVAMLEAALVLLSSSVYIATRTASRSSFLRMVQGTGDDVIAMSCILGALGGVFLVLSVMTSYAKRGRSPYSKAPVTEQSA